MAKVRPPSRDSKAARERAAELLDAALEARRHDPRAPFEGRLAVDLKRHRELIADAIARRLERERGEARLALIEGVGRLGEPAFAAPLVAFVRDAAADPSVKRAAVAAAAALDPEAAAPLAGPVEEANRLAAASPAELADEGGEEWTDRVAALPGRLAADTVEAFFARFPQALPRPLPPLERLRGRHEALDLTLVDALVRRAEPAVGLFLAAWLGDLRPSGAVEKALRRGLFLLKTRGIAVPEAPRREDEGPRFRPVREIEPDQAWASAIDGVGDRLVWLAGNRRGALYLFQAIVNDERGLVHFQASETSRRTLRERAREAEQAEGFPLVPVEPAYALALVEHAARRQLAPETAGAEAARLAPLPSAYSTARPLLLGEGASAAASAEPPEAPILARRGLDGGMDTAEIEARLARSVELHRLPEFASWLLPEETIRPLVEELDDAARSPLIVGEEQRRERFQQIFDTFADRVFDAAMRDRYRRRLEAQADYLDRLGREEDAKSALAAARGLSPLGPKASRHPFVIALIQKHVALIAAQARRRAAEEPRLVVPPPIPRGA
ncbi:MAG TPA: hypothetical protein VF406_11165 [Thermodesulfobacteriota bacterium]